MIAHLQMLNECDVMQRKNLLVKKIIVTVRLCRILKYRRTISSLVRTYRDF